MSDPSPLRYAVRRFMRIWPPLAAFVLVALLVVGPLATTLPVGDYFSNPDTWTYLDNLRLDIRYGLPGVFLENPYPGAVNGSLWTLPVEALMYICVPVLLTFFGAKSKSKALLALCIAACALSCWLRSEYPGVRFVVYGTDWNQAMDIIPFYLIGMVCSRYDIRKYLNLQAAAVLILVLSCSMMSYTAMQAVLFLALPYIVFSIALARTRSSARWAKRRRYPTGYTCMAFRFNSCSSMAAAVWAFRSASWRRSSSARDCRYWFRMRRIIW